VVAYYIEYIEKGHIGYKVIRIYRIYRKRSHNHFAAVHVVDKVYNYVLYRCIVLSYNTFLKTTFQSFYNLRLEFKGN
jgi:hypothetical protein